MLQAKMVDQKGKDAGEVTLPAEIFSVKPREHLLFDTVVMQLASRRQGSAKTKARSEVRGGGRKPYKQKGTGNARRGTNRSPLMPGGGRIFGPVPRDFSYRLPRQVRREALRVALSQKQREGKLLVVSEFTMKAPKTQSIAAFLGQLHIGKALIVDSDNVILGKSVRNLAGVKYLDAKGLNVFDVLKYDHLLLTSASMKEIEKGLAQ